MEKFIKQKLYMGDPVEQSREALDKVLDDITILGLNGKYRLIKKYWGRYVESLKEDISDPNLKRIDEVINYGLNKSNNRSTKRRT